jgi:dolichyl-phosphate beta-glucosyltransferase
VRIAYVVPAHNEERILADTVARVVSRLKAHPGSSVALVENGSRDGTARVCRELEGEREGVRVLADSIPAAGIGYAYHRGIELSLDAGADWLVLTAADLPFDFGDLDGFLRALAAEPGLRLAIGSKAHPESRIDTSSLRKTMSFGYRVARRALVGMRTGDSQGSIFLESGLARPLWPRISSRDFFYTTELIALAEHRGVRPLELPVTLQKELRASTVRPVKHSVAMLRKLLELRRRLVAEPRA